MSELYLFDTNILVHLVRDDATGQQIRARYQPFSYDPQPRFCSVTEGELRSLALQFSWGKHKLNQMEFALAHLGRLTIEDAEVMKAYAMLDAYAQARGIKMGKNDLWIAAVTFVADARLVTTDKDFDHLEPGFIHVDKIKYATLS
ncbi:MAG: PIN domain-containing protein [Acidobacteria bacterium]|nr:PIN domain-containing protein [Acidobacteriota bacterium]